MKAPFNISFRQFSTENNLAKKVNQRKSQEIQPTVRTEVSAQRVSHHPQASFEEGLSHEQRTVLDLVLKKGKSVFFTGPAGTGKSFLLKKIIEGLAIKYLDDSEERFAVTASTGLAASNLGGRTLHSFAGIKLGNAPTTKLIMDVFDNKMKLRRWLSVKVLIIDEVSMVDCTLFDKLDVIGRAVRGVEKPFGGIQLVITGDFFQLPPVVQGQDTGAPRFCFEANAWKDAVQHTISLTQIYRQKDPVFASMLNEIREGYLSPSTIGAFRRLNRPVTALVSKGLEAAELFPLRREADWANARRMLKLKSRVFTYRSMEGGVIEDPNTRKSLLSNCPAPELLELKTGAQVMLVKNLRDSPLVNGSQGTVVGFANKETFFHDRWLDQDYMETPEGDFRTEQLSTTAVQPEERLPLYPVVRFNLPNGYTQTILCPPEEWTIERWIRDRWQDSGWVVEKLATRIQVPLILAWALSIHKAQGQTLSLVKVDLNRVFERGQAYVALSRASSMDGLQVLNFNPNRIRAHPKVKEFYASLSRI